MLSEQQLTMAFNLPYVVNPAATAILTTVLAVLLFLYYLFRKPKTSLRPPPEAGGAWPVIGHLHLLAGSQPPHITLANMADKYGPIFTIRMGVHRALIVSSWEIAKECFTTNDKAFANRPKAVALEHMAYNYAMFGFSPYGPYWRQLRKIVTLELLSNHRLQMLCHVRQEEVKTAIRDIYQKWNNNNNNNNRVEVDMKKWFGDLTLNVALRMIVGKRYVEEENDEQCKRAIRKFFKLTGTFVLGDAIPYLRCLDLGGYERDMKRTGNELDQMLEKWLEEHKRIKRDSGGGICNRKDDDRKDFMGVMLSILDGPEEISSYDADTIIKSTCLPWIWLVSKLLAASSGIRASATLRWPPPATEESEHPLTKIKGAIGQVAAIAKCASGEVVSRPRRQLMVAGAFLRQRCLAAQAKENADLEGGVPTDGLILHHLFTDGVTNCGNTVQEEFVDHLEVAKIEELDDQIGLGVVLEAPCGPTNQVDEEIETFEAATQVEESQESDVVQTFVEKTTNYEDAEKELYFSCSPIPLCSVIEEEGEVVGSQLRDEQADKIQGDELEISTNSIGYNLLPFGSKQAARWANGSEGTLKHVHGDFLMGDFETKSAAQPLIASLQEIETSFAQVGTKTNQGISVLLHGTIEIQLEKPTIESIIFEDLAVKPPILVGQLVDSLRRVQQELDENVGRERQVRESDVKNLIYLQAVIKETLRLYPAGPLLAPRESSEDCTVGGYQIPAGTRLLVNASKLHRDPNVWSDPLEFRPERFLTTHKDVEVGGQNFEMIPFGTGRRICPGISFSLQVLQLALASLLHGFEVTTLFDEPIDMRETVGLSNLLASSLDVLVTPRLPTEAY
ncbi:hypothetical protein TIFTF001_040179 [Ficus carica]|uniref:Cytochrome P450 n=1 Tax=Ficus carica TaxID=3494 RepID=A0AA87Z9X2_FICCA|nr:hypothetical protein TIFTF001_040173 [Ficus carica]GMN22105.1 hypothetical protein TIFTF001_040179 [Ficus carica]